MSSSSSAWLRLVFRCSEQRWVCADLLLVLLVDGIQGILDGDTLQIPGGDLQTKGEVQVNLLDRRTDEWKLEDVLVIDCTW